MKPPLNAEQSEFASLMAAAQWSGAETARRLEFSRSAVSQILSGKNTPTHQTLQLLRRLVADAIECGGKQPDEKGKAAEVLSPAFTELTGAPVVSWASAGQGAVYSDLAGLLDEIVKTDCRDPNKYALIVEGDSMEPVFRPGDRIVVAPNEAAQNGDVVVARLESTGEVFFKLYHEVAKGKVRLTSYNQAYPPIERKKSDFRFIQPVYEMTRKTLRRGGRR